MSDSESELSDAPSSPAGSITAKRINKPLSGAPLSSKQTKDVEPSTGDGSVQASSSGREAGKMKSTAERAKQKPKSNAASTSNSSKSKSVKPAVEPKKPPLRERKPSRRVTSPNASSASASAPQSARSSVAPVSGTQAPTPPVLSALTPPPHAPTPPRQFANLPDESIMAISPTSQASSRMSLQQKKRKTKDMPTAAEPEAADKDAGGVKKIKLTVNKSTESSPVPPESSEMDLDSRGKGAPAKGGKRGKPSKSDIEAKKNEGSKVPEEPDNVEKKAKHAKSSNIAKKKVKRVINSDDEEDEATDGPKTSAPLAPLDTEMEDTVDAQPPPKDVGTGSKAVPDKKAKKNKRPVNEGDSDQTGADEPPRQRKGSVDELATTVTEEASAEAEPAELNRPLKGHKSDKEASASQGKLEATPINSTASTPRPQTSQTELSDTDKPVPSKKKSFPSDLETTKSSTPSGPKTKLLGSQDRLAPSGTDAAAAAVFKKKKKLPGALGNAKGGSTASPGPAAVPSLLSSTLAALSATPVKGLDKKEVKSVSKKPQWTDEWVMSSEQRKEYEDSKPQRDAERAERAKWKLNAVNLQAAKDALKIEAEEVRRLNWKLSTGEPIGPRTDPVLAIEAMLGLSASKEA